VGTEEQHPTPNAEHPTPNLQVYPNPFSTQTTISAKWNKSARVNIEIYNAAGLLVKTLQQGKQLPGSCKIPWNGTDNSGNILPAGIYYIVLRIENKETESVKVIKQ
jgi:flagellar hook assembly protein FlgD